MERAMSYVSLIPFLVAVFLAAWTGARFMPGEWYTQIAKPNWTPPGWLFGPVWTVLYLMIAIAGWRVWGKVGFGPVLAVWMLQLVLNMAWSWIMFGRHDIGLALVDVIAMWVAIALFMVLAWPVDRVAVYLFAPYLAWVSFAGALNFSIWRLNTT